MFFRDLLFFVVFVFCSFFCFGQSADLYSFDNSRRFADYLFVAGQYDLAVKEYERVLFLHPENDSVKYDLMRSYYFSGQFERGVSRAHCLYERPELMDERAAVNYVKLQYSAELFADCRRFLALNKYLSVRLKNELTYLGYVLERKPVEGLRLIDSVEFENEKIRALVCRVENIRYKKPSIAVLLSAIVPGGGKIYAGRTADGIIAFLFTGLNGWQAWRGFTKKGIDSPYGWIFGAMTVGFYFGGVYGSYKSVRIFNSKLDNDLREKAVRILRSDY